MLVTTKEALALLKISRPTLYGMWAEGVLVPVPVNPALRKARQHYWRREDIERVITVGRNALLAKQQRAS